jgi:transcriptional regulator with XRE-family HTH domain
MRLDDIKRNLAENVSRLLKKSGAGEARLAISKRIGVGDGTLGRIAYGTGNPSLETLVQLATFFRVKPWELLMPPDGLRSASTPASPVQTELLAESLRLLAEAQAESRTKLDPNLHATFAATVYRQLERNLGTDHAKNVVADLLSAMRTAHEEHSS